MNRFKKKRNLKEELLEYTTEELREEVDRRDRETIEQVMRNRVIDLSKRLLNNTDSIKEISSNTNNGEIIYKIILEQ